MFVAIANPGVAAFEILELDGVEYSHTGDLLLTNLKTITVPGGTLLNNGALKIKASGTAQGANNSKTMGVTWGSSGFGSGIIIPPGNNAEWEFEAMLFNVNNDAVQSSMWRYYGGSGGVQTIDSGGVQDDTEFTAFDVTIIVQVQLGNAADSIQLQNICVELFPQV